MGRLGVKFHPYKWSSGVLLETGHLDLEMCEAAFATRNLWIPWIRNTRDKQTRLTVEHFLVSYMKQNPTKFKGAYTV